jgi:hypothetical protein
MNVVAVLVGTACFACAPCDNEACDAMSKRAPEQASQTRVAGIVASQSDVVANDCQECQFAEAPVHAWSRAKTVTTDAELREVAVGTPAASSTSSKQGVYTLSLEAGDYLQCVQSSCFNVSAVEGRTTTLNVRLINGISSGFVRLPSASSFTRVDGLFLPPDLNP